MESFLDMFNSIKKNLLFKENNLYLLIFIIINLFFIISLGSSFSNDIKTFKKEFEIQSIYSSNINFSNKNNILAINIDGEKISKYQIPIVIEDIFLAINKYDKNLYKNIEKYKSDIINVSLSSNNADDYKNEFLAVTKNNTNTIEIIISNFFIKSYNNLGFLILIASFFASTYYMYSLINLVYALIFKLYNLYTSNSFFNTLLISIGLFFYFINFFIGHNIFFIKSIHIYTFIQLFIFINFLYIILLITMCFVLFYLICLSKSYYLYRNSEMAKQPSKIKLFFIIKNLTLIESIQEVRNSYLDFINSQNIYVKSKKRLNKKYLKISFELIYHKEKNGIFFDEQNFISKYQLTYILNILKLLRDKVSVITLSLVTSISVSVLFLYQDPIKELIYLFDFYSLISFFYLFPYLFLFLLLIFTITVFSIIVDFLSFNAEISFLEEILHDMRNY